MSYHTKFREAEPGVPANRGKNVWTPTAEYRGLLETWMPAFLPAGVPEMRFFLWREFDQGKRPHDRFILTDRGGCELSAGLDEATSAAADQRISLLGENVWRQARLDYSDVSTSFDLADRFTISGTLASART